MFLRDYIQHKGGERLGPFVVLQLLTLAVLCALGYWRFSTMGIFLVLGGLAFAFFAAWRYETYVLLFLAYLGFLPNAGYADQFEILPVFFQGGSTLPAMALIYTMFLLQRNMGEHTHPCIQPRTDHVGTIIILFLTLVAIQTFRGFANGHPVNFMRLELFYLLLYSAYFFWRANFRWKANMTRWVAIVGILGAFVSLEYILLVIVSFQDIVSFVLYRFVTQQGQLTAAAFPILATLFFVSRKSSQKAAALVGMLLVGIQILLSQQRTLWGVLAFEVLLYFTLYMFRNGFHARVWLRWFLIIVGAIAFFISMLFLGSFIFGVDLTFLLSRWQDVQSLTDRSFLMRVYDAKRAMGLVGNRWLTGLGIGAYLRVIPTSQLYYYFDISYLVAYFKGGIPLVILLVSIYLAGLLRSFQVFRRAPRNTTRLYGAAIFTILVGQMLSGLTTVSMLYYRFIFVWVLLIAAAVVLYEQLDEEEDVLSAKANRISGE